MLTNFGFCGEKILRTLFHIWKWACYGAQIFNKFFFLNYALKLCRISRVVVHFSVFGYNFRCSWVKYVLRKMNVCMFVDSNRLYAHASWYPHNFKKIWFFFSHFTWAQYREKTCSPITQNHVFLRFSNHISSAALTFGSVILNSIKLLKRTARWCSISSCTHFYTSCHDKWKWSQKHRCFHSGEVDFLQLSKRMSA